MYALAGWIMFIRIFIAFFSLLCSFSSWSIICYYTLAKDSCWTEYNVTVGVIDSRTGATLTTVTVPKGKQWVRKEFACQPGQKLMYTAQFSPVFWQADIGKSYSAQNYWFLPDAVNPGDTAWTLSVCYPSDFSLVPMPPTANGTCACDFSGIPQIKPQ